MTTMMEGGVRAMHEEAHRMRAMANYGANLGLGMEFSMVQRVGDGSGPRACPVQLDLLPLRPSSQSNSNSLVTAPSVPSSTSFRGLAWQPLVGSRTNSGSGNEDGEVTTYTSGGRGGSPRCGIDVNQIPSTDGEEEAAVSSPSSIGMKRGRGKIQHEFDLERNATGEMSSRGGSDDEDEGTARKKLRLSKEQSALLEESFKEHSTLNPKQKNALAKQLGLRPRQVEVWFQNRRARTKLKQTEVDCELLKRCVETLTEENRRLQKELQELRAIKVAPPCVISHDFYMPLPAATLTMCPSCERVATVDNRSLTFAKPGFSHLSQSSAAC
ncbi:homeobox-leucine zipper protein HAT4 [Physcomitrium patens]|uniref:Homeobox domain-containing protein n=1 Tax=Physcomitrium patens TaxID=3218 RepID=A0A2K1KAR2_PHYPA|nr:homeobox-leucine zipper protein HAT4-like [Physcomitrium patens]PNR50867.1 hypothetical protein PHYPA_010053 [Physcomitrium patens]|eukprot:XP_024379716.1 homeobox-leucine zipper protein HAT4-like [Physcomitrella patens]